MLQCSEDEDVAAPQELLDVYKASVNSSKSTRRILIKSRYHLLAMNASPSLIASTLLEEKYRAVNFLLTDNYWLKVQCLAELMWFHSFLIIENLIEENQDKIIINIGRQGFTEVRLNKFFTSTRFSRYVCIVFPAKDDNFLADCHY